MKRKNSLIKRITSFVLLTAIGINTFGSSVPYGMKKVYATEYEEVMTETDEAATEEMEEEPVKQRTAYESLTISSETTLKADMEVDNLTVNNKLHLNGYKLVVHGDIILNSGLYIEEGFLAVEGSYKEEKQSKLVMESVNDYITIKKDYIYCNNTSVSYYVMKGTIEIQGNIYGKSGNSTYGGPFFQDTCKVILSGSVPQTVDIRTKSAFKISQLVIKNTSEEGVLAKYLLSCEKILDEDNKLHYPVTGEVGDVLEEDMVIEGDYFLLGGILDLAGYNLTIKGNLIHAGGIIDINGGNLVVEGDYKKQYIYTEDEKTVYGNSIGRLLMDDVADYMLVNGDYIDSGIYGTEKDLIAGTLELKGNLNKDTHLACSAFETGGRHVLKLTGNKQQYLKGTVNLSGLMVEQGESGSVNIDSEIIVYNYISHKTPTFNGKIRFYGQIIDSDDLYGDIEIRNPFVFKNNCVFHGNLYLGEFESVVRNATIDDCHITVIENLYLKSSVLDMTGESGLLTVEKDIILRNNTQNHINNGALELGGNLLKENIAFLEAGSKSKIFLTGKTLQKIDIKNDKTILNNIVVDNPEGVVVSDGINIGNVTSKQGMLFYSSGAVHGFSLENDEEYEGDLSIGGGVLDLNGHSYHVKGDLTITGGMLNMTNPNDTLIVDGNFKISTPLSNMGRLTEGMLEVKGDFSQEGNAESFPATDNHTTILNGTKKQTVSFRNTTSSFFQNLTFNNPEGIFISGNSKALGMIKQTNSLVEGILKIGATSVFENSCYKGNVYMDSAITMSDNMQIAGNLYIDKSLFLNGFELDVDGAVYCYKDLNIQKGLLKCNMLDVTYIFSRIVMNNIDDEIIVEKDLKLSSGGEYKLGHITLGGDFTYEGDSSLKQGDEFVFELNGTSKQTLTNNASFTFGTLVLNNTSEEGICIAGDLRYVQLKNLNDTKIVFADGGILGYTLAQDEIIEGDFIISSGRMDLNGHTLTVKGDLIQSGGEMFINNGSLIVEKDYYIARCRKKEDGTYYCSKANALLKMKNSSDMVTIYGNLHSSTSSYMCEAGTLNLFGNLLVTNSNFVMGINSNLVMNGKEVQEISFAGDVRLANLDIQNKKGIKCTNKSEIVIYGSLKTNGNPIDGCLYINRTAVIEDDYINANIDFTQDYILNKDLYVNGWVNLNCLRLNEHHFTVEGDCLLNQSLEQTNGVLEVKGNLKYKQAQNGYKGSGTNKVILSGDKKQTIYTNDLNFNFQELIIKNTSNEGVYSEGLFNVNIVDDPERKLSFYTKGDAAGYTLTEDTVISGDFNLIAGTMNLNGHKLTITGNLIHKHGTIDINGGTLEVYGDYCLENINSSGKVQMNQAKLVMDDEADYVCFYQDVTLSPTIDISAYLTAGTMEMKGDFTYRYYNQLLQLDKNLRMVFSGNEKQIINDIQDQYKVQLGTLDIENTSAEGVVIVTNFQITNPVIGNGNLNGIAENNLRWNNGMDIPFESWSGNLILYDKCKLVNNLTVDGKLIIYEEFDMNGYHLITDDISIRSKFIVNDGILQVRNDLSLDSYYYSKFIMDNENGYVQVTGNLAFTNGKIDLTAGNLDIKGNVEISDVNLTASGTHTTTLSGKTTSKGTAYIQTITINNGIFNKLVLTKPREYYVFNRAAEDLCAELIDDVQDITAPSVPKGLSASDIGYTGLKLSWQESTDDTGIAGYDIYRNGKKIMSVSGTSFVDKNLAPGTEYTYYVTAKDEVLNTSAISEKISVLTLADTKAPEIPTGIELLERNGHSLAFRWNPSKDNVKTCGYTVYRNGEKLETVQGTEYTDNGLTENSHYTYSISAYDADGNESEASEEVNFYTQAVEVAEFTPAEYGKISGKSTELKLDFMNAGSKNGYRVFIGYREKGQENYKELISGMKGVGTAYRKMISVKAELDTESITAEEIEVLIRITDASGYEVTEHYTYYLDKAAPSRMEEVRAEAADGVAFISYAKGTEADIRGYYIYREEEGKERERIADITDKDKTYYYDKTILDGVNYNYYVSAYDEEGYEGELSDAVNVQGNKDESMPVIRGVEPVSGVLCGRAKLLVTAEDNKSLDKVLLEVYQKETDSYVSLEEKSIEDGKAELYFDTNGFKNEVTLRFTVWDKAGNQNEEPFERTYVTDNEGPASVNHLDAEVISTTVVLSWDAPAEEDFSYFVVEERMEEEWREAARTTTVTGYVFEGLIPQSTHVYRVTAYDIYGNKGVPSEELSVTVNEDTICPRITSVKPNGGYYKESIPLTVKAYDNIALANLIMEYSYDKENWNVCYETSFEKERKEETVYYELSLEDMDEGDIYIRAYAEDTAGNVGDKEQVLLQCKVDKTAPEKIAKLTAAGEAGSIKLSWNEPTDNDVAGYKIYRSMEGVNAYKIIASSVKALGFYDDGAVYDAVYSYKVTAYDHAGNESELSNAVTAQKLPDDMIPSVHSLSPENDSWVSGEKELSAYVSDNDMVSTVEFAIKNADEDAVKMILDTVSVKQKAGTAVCPLDTTEYENGVYTLYVTAKDAAGNISKTYESVLHICNVVMEVPELTGLPGNWCSLLSYNGSPEYTYVLYCRELSEESFRTVWSGTGSLLYKDNNVNPKYTYVYQLLIQDKAGNVNYSPLVYVKPNPVDDRCPTAVITAGTSVVEGYEVVFNGIESSDNDKIAEYLWDFGDGTEPSSNPAPVHKYEKAGNYNVTLTVKDPAGNTDDTTIKVTVLPKNDAGKAVIEVRNIYGTPLKGVSVYVNTSAEHNDTAYTDKNGRAAVMQRPGTYRVALYKPGYVAEEKEIEIELHGDTNYVFTIAEGETISADFKVRQLSFEEIVAAGIDINAPENQHVFTVETTLSFSDMNRVESYTEEVNMTPANSVVNKASNGAYVPPKKPQDEKPGEEAKSRRSRKKYRKNSLWQTFIIQYILPSPFHGLRICIRQL